MNLTIHIKSWDYDVKGWGASSDCYKVELNELIFGYSNKYFDKICIYFKHSLCSYQLDCCFH